MSMPSIMFKMRKDRHGRDHGLDDIASASDLIPGGRFHVALVVVVVVDWRALTMVEKKYKCLAYDKHGVYVNVIVIAMEADDYVCVARSRLNCRVIPDKRIFFHDMITRQNHNRYLSGREIASILGEKKLVEHYPWDRPLTDLHHLVPQDDFPCRIGLVGPDGRVVIRLVQYGSTVRQIQSDLDIPPGFRMFWFRFAMYGPTLDSLVLERKQPLSPNSFFPNIMHNTVSLGYIVPESSDYIVLHESEHSMDIRSGPGLPLHVLPVGDGLSDLRSETIRVLQPYCERALDRYFVAVHETYIPTDGEGPTFAEYYVRTPLKTNPEVNDIIMNDDADMSAISVYVTKRARFVQTWQRMERDTSSTCINRSYISSSLNKTKYKLLIDDDGRLGLEYYLENTNGVLNAREEARSVHVCSLNEFPDTMITPSMLYDTETHMFERIGLFRSRYTVLDAMKNVYPSHVQNVQVPVRDAVWSDDSLYTYQKEGVEAMIAHESTPDGLLGLYVSRMSGASGQPGLFSDMNRKVLYIEHGFEYTAGMFCDDVGMGKTRQMVALIRHTRANMDTATLILVPPTILQQWITEIKSVWPGVRLLVMYGRDRTRVDLDTDMTQSDIAISTYSTFLRYEDEFSCDGQPWDRVIFDESHAIPRSFAHVTLPRKKSWFVTATPDIQYRRTMSLIMRGFPRYISSLDSIQQRLEATDRTSVNETKYRFMRPLVFRRTRDRYLDLPEVHTVNVFMDLSEREYELYSDVLDNVRVYRMMMSSLEAFHALRALQNVASTSQALMPLMHRRVAAIDDTTDVWFHPEIRISVSEVPSDAECPICLCPILTEATKTVCQHWFCRECIGNAMIRNNQCPLCRHVIDRGTVFLVEDDNNEGGGGDDVVDLTVEDTDPDLSRDPGSVGDASTKISRVTQDVQHILRSSPHERILVFVESQIVLEAYSLHFEAVGIPFTCVHGGVSVTTRSRRLNSFQNDENCPYRVMLLTVKTSSAGITLTRANHIMLVSPVVPREMETQMIGRSHRLGQNQPVKFIRYIANGTIEVPLARSSITTRDVPQFVREYIQHDVPM